MREKILKFLHSEDNLKTNIGFINNIIYNLPGCITNIKYNK